MEVILSPAARNHLVERWMGLTARLVEKQWRQASWADWQDLMDAAVDALLKAVDAYDPSTGVGIKQWIGLKVSFALKDKVRVLGGYRRTRELPPAPVPLPKGQDEPADERSWKDERHDPVPQHRIEVEELVDWCENRLSGQPLEIFRLIHREGLDYEQSAPRLGLSPTGVRKIYLRTVARLKEILELAERGETVRASLMR